jgi:hypothetical protein
MLRPGGYGFFALRQAYGSLRWQGQTFTGYRQYIDELEVSPHDNRMVPQTFEAYALRGQLGDVRYFAGYVAAVKPRDYSAHAQRQCRHGPGQPQVRRPDQGHARCTGIGLHRAGHPVVELLRRHGRDPHRRGLQGPAVRSVHGPGQHRRRPADGRSFRHLHRRRQGRCDLGPIMLTGAFMQTGSAAEYRTPYGIFIGYNKQEVADFDRAGERSFQIGATYDFKGVDLPGATFLANAVYGANAVDPTTGAELSQRWEYNLDLQLRAAQMPLEVPGWLKPLQLRGRIAFVGQYLGHITSSFTDTA